ncbi:SDR family oxidoreductase [Magnetospirillum molischianum]|uniref:Nucleoside-diphosphate-sugar epimerase n=1 Tax=Magnetospirillum molischianum DSM 120 TaxID=1150626 RepID=H8FRN6_MAGML|nr:SDR family oxidoreductase [Magnetospirillum molischianum]CCG41024.1 Nucleoside-diphosphate-sugar epimerase [Magnetospirillum molischianum DSM 120]
MGEKIFVFGLGYSGKTVARALLDRGWIVAGTTRSGRVDDLPGVETFAFDRDHPVPDSALDGVSAILSTVPPDAEGDPVVATMGHALRMRQPRWVGYLSTTGLYGDHGGGWVDETTPPDPTQDRSRRRLEAEQSWQESGMPLHMFRLAGIYGPGRSAIEQVLSGTARRINKPGQMFSRIHVEDIARSVLASLDRPAPGTIYNLCDDDPAPPQDVILHACSLLGVEPPAEISWDEARASLSPMALGFYADNKRVSNRRMREELGVELAYPSYRDGLAAIARGKRSTSQSG